MVPTSSTSRRYILQYQINLPCLLQPLSPPSSPQPPLPHPPTPVTTTEPSSPINEDEFELLRPLTTSMDPIEQSTQYSALAFLATVPLPPVTASTTYPPAPPPGPWTRHLRPRQALSSGNLASPSRRPGTLCPPWLSDPDRRELAPLAWPVPSRVVTPPLGQGPFKKRKTTNPWPSLTSRRTTESRNPAPTFLAPPTASRPLTHSLFPSRPAGFPSPTHGRTPPPVPTKSGTKSDLCFPKGEPRTMKEVNHPNM